MLDAPRTRAQLVQRSPPATDRRRPGGDSRTRSAFMRLRTVRFCLLIATGAGSLAAAACRETVLVPPRIPAGSRAIDPPTIYRDWWAETQACSGLDAPLDRISWFVVPDQDTFEYEGRRFDAHWWSMYHWIVLAEAHMQDAATVRHEMLHDLLGRGDHPAAYFQGKCGEVVACRGECSA